jgi:phenylacetate-CoA ligase
MVRFATGDLTIIDDAPCGCGRTYARMRGWRGRADAVTKVRGMFIHPRQADEVASRAPGVQRFQVVVGRQGHEDTLTLRVELAPGTDPSGTSKTLEGAIREVMKLRGSIDVVGAGTIPEGAKKIADERKWD